MVRKLILTATAITALAAPMAITMTADAAPTTTKTTTNPQNLERMCKLGQQLACKMIAR